VNCLSEFQRDAGKHGDSWELNSEYDVIEPFSTAMIGTTVTLVEGGPHTATLHVQMTEALAHLDIKLKAHGSGTGVTFNPTLETNDIIDFGTLFTYVRELIGTFNSYHHHTHICTTKFHRNVEKSFQFEVTNSGHMPKILDWRHVRDSPPKNLPPNIKNNMEKPSKKPQETKGASQAKKKKVMKMTDDYFMSDLNSILIV
jgi:hypothetical protein